MNLKVSYIDAFTDTVFRGNPAAVIITDSWLAEGLMQEIAMENNLSETAFAVKVGDQYQIRWFSPFSEVDFCGHATLATAFVLFNERSEADTISFYAKAVGELDVSRTANDFIQMNFPKRAPEPVEEKPAALLRGLSIAPREVHMNQQAYFAVYDSEEQVVAVEQDPELVKQLKPYDVCVTAASEKYDFVSRYFWPANGGLEDPVTGSIHTGLAPFWSKRLGKYELKAHQASKRGGDLLCRVNENRVFILGKAVKYMTGNIEI